MKWFRGNYNIYFIGVVCTLLILLSVCIVNNLNFDSKEDRPIIVDKTQNIKKDKYNIEIKYP